MDVDEIFDAWERAWSGRDPHGFESVCDPGVHYEDPLTPEPLSGVAALSRHAQRLWRAFPDARLNATGERLGHGRFACAPCRLLGTHQGRLGRISPTGRFVVVHAVIYAELRDERILRARTFFDAYGAAVELGLLPKAGTAGERALLMLRGFGLRG
jgi:ketosteroid isomerase-like protein